MSTVPLTGTPAFAGNDRLLAGIVLSVLTFWLFAQSVINVVPAMKNSLDISLETLTLAVSLSALFSGCFVVASGGFADKFGRVRLTVIGLVLSIIGSGLLFLTREPVLFLLGRAIQGLSAACIMPATLALIKTWYDGKARQRAISFWVIGSWGGSGLSSFVGGAIATSLGWRWILFFPSRWPGCTAVDPRYAGKPKRQCWSAQAGYWRVGEFCLYAGAAQPVYQQRA